MKIYNATTKRVQNPDGALFNTWHLKNQNVNQTNTDYRIGCNFTGSGAVKMIRADSEPDFTQQEKDDLEAAIEYLNNNTHPVMP